MLVDNTHELTARRNNQLVTAARQECTEPLQNSMPHILSAFTKRSLQFPSWNPMKPASGNGIELFVDGGVAQI